MKIIVTHKFNFDHRPENSFCTTLKVSPDPQTVKNNVGEAAIASGCAHKFKPKVKENQNGESNYSNL